MCKVKGKCSICGGRVVEPTFWHGVMPARAQCENCHAVEAGDGPVIQMVPLQQPPALQQPFYVPLAPFYVPQQPDWWRVTSQPQITWLSGTGTAEELFASGAQVLG